MNSLTEQLLDAVLALPDGDRVEFRGGGDSVLATGQPAAF